MYCQTHNICYVEAAFTKHWPTSILVKNVICTTKKSLILASCLIMLLSSDGGIWQGSSLDRRQDLRKRAQHIMGT